MANLRRFYMYKINTEMKDETAGIYQSPDGRKVHISFHRGAWVTLQVDDDKSGYAFLAFRSGQTVEEAGFMSLPSQSIVNRLQGAGLPNAVVELSAYFLALAARSENRRFLPDSGRGELLKLCAFGALGLGGAAAFATGIMHGMQGLAVFGVVSAIAAVFLCGQNRAKGLKAEKSGAISDLAATGASEILNWPEIVTKNLEI